MTAPKSPTAALMATLEKTPATSKQPQFLRICSAWPIGSGLSRIMARSFLMNINVGALF
jgi:hypothetical protein